MKRYSVLLLILCCMLLSPKAFGASKEWSFSLSAGLRYDRFADKFENLMKWDDLGNEFTFPAGFTFRWKELSLSGETAYSSASIRDGHAELSSFTDSRLSVSYLIHQLPLFTIILGADLNLETGKEQLSDRERQVEQGGNAHGDNNDLFEVDDFGEGRNIGGSIGISRSGKQFSVGLTGAYLHKGEYDRTKGIDEGKFDPGDQIMGVLQINRLIGSRANLEAYAAYVRSAEDELGGNKMFREGDKWLFGGNLLLLPERWRITARLQYTMQQENEELNKANRLTTESKNSNGGALFAMLDTMYYLSEKWTLRFLAACRYYGESERKDVATGHPVEGKRTRYAIGPGFILNINENFSLDVLLKYFHLTQEKEPGVPEEAAYHGSNFSLSFRYTF